MNSFHARSRNGVARSEKSIEIHDNRTSSSEIPDVFKLGFLNRFARCRYVRSMASECCRIVGIIYVAVPKHQNSRHLSYSYLFDMQKLTTSVESRLAFGTDLASEDWIRLSTVLVRDGFVASLRNSFCSSIRAICAGSYDWSDPRYRWSLLRFSERLRFD